MPNGNELADILMTHEPGRLTIPWGSEYWETEKPTFKGYGKWFEQRYGRLPRGAYREAKDISEELANILSRPEVKMLDPLQRADLIDKIAKAQAVIAKREQEREKHEAEQLEFGRQKQMQEKVQAILQSDRVPAQKLTALTMIGVPLSDAQDMIWGKRAPGEEAGRPAREAAPRARAEPEELAAALRPEARGVQFRMVGGELIKEPAGIWRERRTPEEREAELKEAEYYRTLAVKREHPEMLIPLEERKFKVETERKKDEFNLELAKFGHTKEMDERTADLARDKFLLTIKEFGFEVAKEKSRKEEFWAEFGITDRESQEAAMLATKEFALEVEKFGLEDTVAKHGMQIEAGKLKLDVRKQEDEMKKWKEAEKQLKREFGEAVGKRKFDEKMRTLEFQEAAKKTENEYELAKLTEAHAWKETLFNQGFKNKEFVELSNRFWGTLDFNKEKEKTRAKEFGVEIEWDKEKEANVMDRFEAELEQEYKRLDLDVKTMGLNKETEARIAKMAMLQFGLDEKKLGLDEAILKWKKLAEKKEWWFKEEELGLKNTQAQRLFLEFIYKIGQDAKELGLKEAIHDHNIRKLDKEMELEWAKLDEKKKKIVASGCFDRLTTACAGLSGTETNELTETWEALFNKEGQIVEPGIGERKRATEFVIGEDAAETDDEPRTKAELPINMSDSDYVTAVLQTTTFSKKQKAWLLWKRFTPLYWEGMQGAAGTLGNLAVPGEEEPVAGEGLGARIMGGIRTELGKWGEEGKRIAEWWPFGKGKETRDIRVDAARLGKEWTATGREITRGEMEGQLRALGYSDEEIRGMWGE